MNDTVWPRLLLLVYSNEMVLLCSDIFILLGIADHYCDKLSLLVNNSSSTGSRMYSTCCLKTLHQLGYIKWKSAFEHGKMCSIRSSCMCTKYHPGLCSPFIHSVEYNDSVSRQWRPWSDCTDVQSDLGLCCPLMPEVMFFHVFEKGKRNVFKYNRLSFHKILLKIF